MNMNDLPEKIQNWRTDVLNAFDHETGYYYHTSLRQYDNFIDMLAWVGWMACGAHYMGDQELLDKCLICVNKVLTVGENARTFAPIRVTEAWKESPTIPGYFYKEKEQSFAGPSAWLKMRQLGLPVVDPLGNPFTEESVMKEAKRIANWASMFGWASHWFSSLRQHINSTWLALEVTGHDIPSSLDWTRYQNPFFDAIAGEAYVDLDSMPSVLPDWSDATTVSTHDLQPLMSAGSSDWVWRRDPYNKLTVSSSSVIVKYYTPIALLCAAYFQIGRTIK